jgi:NAD(P)-dependent dehydrogenase (short-subunit alcohol dehydrogenase family)
MQFDGKVAIVTGGASGIGAACARAFAARGAKVAVADLNLGEARNVVADIGGLAVKCDVGDELAINELVAVVENELGPIDIFFSNAGIANGSDPFETPLDAWQQQWDVNVMSYVYAARAVLPGMLARKSGYLIYTASMAGILTTHGNLPYAVTKHAAVGFAE